MKSGIGASERRDRDFEATDAERVWRERTEALERDPDWRAFRERCYPETGRPAPGALPAGVERLRAAAERGHAWAQHRLATELHAGRGRLGLAEDAAEAATWYAAAAGNGHPAAVMHLAMLYVAHPEVPRVHDGAGQYLDTLLRAGGGASVPAE